MAARISRTRKPVVPKHTKLSFTVEVEYGGDGATVEDSRGHIKTLLGYASAARIWKGPGGVNTKHFVVIHETDTEDHVNFMRKRVAGFSLIELAVVLFIMSIMATGMITGLVSMVKTNEHGQLRSLMDSSKGELLLNTAKTKTCPVDCQYTVTLPTTSYADTWGTPLQFALLGSAVLDKNSPNVSLVQIRSLGPDKAVGGQDDVTVYVTTAELLYLLSRSGL